MDNSRLHRHRLVGRLCHPVRANLRSLWASVRTFIAMMLVMTYNNKKKAVAVAVIVVVVAVVVIFVVVVMLVVHGSKGLWSDDQLLLLLGSVHHALPGGDWTCRR